MKLLTAAVVAATAFGLAVPALAANVDVQMLNKGDDGMFVFEPSAIRIAPGDTVTFLATDKGHNVESIKGLLPKGAKPFKGQMSKPLTVTFDQPGLYAIKCMPHFALGMVALVEVGDDPANLEAIENAKLPKKAKGRIAADLKTLGF